MVERVGKASLVTMQNPRFLNAEDQTTLDALEIAVDLATLDPATRIAVLRGGKLDHPKYRGRRVFGAGINLTRLYRGEIPFTWFLNRDLGVIHKFLRGVAAPDALPDDVHGHGIEKLWIAALEGFAIGGHCQTVLTMDYTVAASDAFLTLPARKEGIIPGLANLRMPRFTGDRIARQAIQFDRKLLCDSPDGRLICDEIVEPHDMDGAIERLVDGLASAGAGRRHRQSPGAAYRPGTARPVPALLLRLCTRPGLLLLQQGAHRQPRTQLGRQEPDHLGVLGASNYHTKLHNH